MCNEFPPSFSRICCSFIIHVSCVFDQTVMPHTVERVVHSGWFYAASIDNTNDCSSGIFMPVLMF